MKKICVYCSSQADLPAEVEAGAAALGAEIGRQGGELIYGGVNAGLMHIVADVARRNGATVTGVVPECFASRVDPVCTNIVKVRDLAERKAYMITHADAFVVLPGGIGTIDEWITTLAEMVAASRRDPSVWRPILVWNNDDLFSGQVQELRRLDSTVYGANRGCGRFEDFFLINDLITRLASL